MNKNTSHVIITNRKALHDYHIIDTFETGIELRGTEVKSLRQKKGNMNDSFARVIKGEVFLFNLHISPYDFGNINNHDPLRTRKLLLHKSEIMKLSGKATTKGFALIPLKLYLKKGKVKVALAIGRGKTQYDKRETIKERDSQREMQRAIRKHNK
ncbi:MAG: SsrA-binding protein SmpB [Candidatus Ancaeobacter aquaticus]|nr:SsrA-binding protein SmpB [Candidatus Ancaeobacter aquaticus]